MEALKIQKSPALESAIIWERNIRVVQMRTRRIVEETGEIKAFLYLTGLSVAIQRRNTAALLVQLDQGQSRFKYSYRPTLLLILLYI